MFSLSGSVHKNGNETYVFTGSKTTIKWLRRLFAAANENLANDNPTRPPQGRGKRKAAAAANANGRAFGALSAPSRVSKSSQEMPTTQKEWDYGPTSRPKKPATTNLKPSRTSTPFPKASVRSRERKPSTTDRPETSSSACVPSTQACVRCSSRPHSTGTLTLSRSGLGLSQCSSKSLRLPAASTSPRPQSTATLTIFRPQSGESHYSITSDSPALARAAVSAAESSRQLILLTPKIVPLPKKLTPSSLVAPRMSKLDKVCSQQQQRPTRPPPYREIISRTKPFNKKTPTTTERTFKNNRDALNALSNAQNPSKPSAEPKIFSYLKPAPGVKKSEQMVFKNPLLKRYHEKKVTAALRFLAHPEIITAETFRVLSAPFQKFLVQTHPETSYLSQTS